MSPAQGTLPTERPGTLRASRPDRLLGVAVSVGSVAAATGRTTGGSPPDPEDVEVRVDGLEVDLARRAVRVDGQEMHLTPTEFDLLRQLIRNRGRLMTHRDLLVSVWGPGCGDDTHVLRAHIANLRRKIEPPEGRRYIRTGPGVGYRFAG